ncbi:imidazole glycerol phosphate synthase subunit HisH [Algimonas porphyrae]|uniref:Imidazole glycerol phosphate synthase subunit HisH n=1 Tax=Algimonas porphyrae TaxID=1128113 RepID=A0ABQ5V5W2_9PROT|nr:imidazole glycerol phosphate synthase subunit HisH [Algimonas porphyrae]GLQ21966.1 imidazole glycerol phosphate synthase subunit HisH [Algimonas porphyrae]
MTSFAVINYGIGNLRSLQRSLDRVGVDAQMVTDPSGIEAAERLLLPGVGHFRACMSAFNASGMRGALEKAVKDGKPLLGICVGMQMLFDGSEEGDFTDGLGFIKGRVSRFSSEFEGAPLRVPHVGFAEIETRDSVLFEGMEPNPRFYFTHSFRAADADPKAIIGVGNYGGSFAAAVQKKRVYGTQFHPEKSHRNGLALLKNYATKG